MRVVRQVPDASSDVIVHSGPATTVGELATLLSLPEGPLRIDGLLVLPTQLLGDLMIRPGAVIAPPDVEPLGLDRPNVMGVVVLTGRDGGRAIELPAGIARLFPRPHIVSHVDEGEPHLIIGDDGAVTLDAGNLARLTIDGLGLTAPVPIQSGQLIEIGKNVVRVAPPTGNARPAMSVHPCERRARPESIEVPAPTVPNALLTRSAPRWGRRRTSLESTTALMTRDYVVALQLARRAEMERRRSAVDDPASLAVRARTLDGLWQRRPRDGDAMTVSVGYCTDVWASAAEQVNQPGELARQLAAAAALPLVPLLIDLRETARIGIIGDRREALACARWLVAQLASQLGPSDIELAVASDADRIGDWGWLKWVDHVRDADGTARVGLHPSEILTMFERKPNGVRLRLAALARDQDHQREAIAIIDRAVSPGALDHAVVSPWMAIALADDAGQLPLDCGTVIDTDLGRVTSGRRSWNARVSGLAEKVAEQWARDLSALIDPDLVAPVILEPANLTRLMGFTTSEELAISIAAAWRTGVRPVVGTDLGGNVVELPLGIVSVDPDLLDVATVAVTACTSRLGASTVVLGGRRSPRRELVGVIEFVDTSDTERLRRALRVLSAEDLSDVAVIVEDAAQLERSLPGALSLLLDAATTWRNSRLIVGADGAAPIVRRSPHPYFATTNRVPESGSWRILVPADLSLDASAPVIEFRLVPVKTSHVVAEWRDAIETAAAGAIRRVIPPPLPDRLRTATVAGTLGITETMDGHGHRPWKWMGGRPLLICGAGAQDARLILGNVIRVLNRPTTLIGRPQWSPHGVVSVAIDDVDAVLGALADIDSSIDSAIRGPDALLVIDDLAMLVSTLSSRGEHDVVDGLERIVRDGPAVGIDIAAATPAVRSMPARVLAAFSQRLVLAMDDPVDAALLGVRINEVITLGPRRALDPSDGTVIQLAESVS